MARAAPLLRPVLCIVQACFLSRESDVLGSRRPGHVWRRWVWRGYGWGSLSLRYRTQGYRACAQDLQVPRCRAGEQTSDWITGLVRLEGDKQPQKERWCWAPPMQLDSLLMPPLVGVLACACMVGREAGRARGYCNAEASLCYTSTFCLICILRSGGEGKGAQGTRKDSTKGRVGP